MGFIFKGVKAVVKAVVGVVKGVVKVVGKVIGGLLGMSRPKANAGNRATIDRLSKRLEPEDFRKIAFGETAAGADLRFWEVHGTDFLTYSEVLACCTHQVEGFGAFYVEEDLLTFDGSGNCTAPAKYAGKLVRRTNNGAVGNAALSVGSGAYWTSASKFTGCAHYALQWGPITQESLPSGVPSRYTQVIKGARVYDPRKDTTVGGSGTHRYNDQSTWAYATLDGNGQPIGRNNALQMLWYLLGWRINGTLVAGRGVDPNDVNWADWIAAANDAEAKQYYTDMLLSTGDSHETNEAIISCDGLIGELLDPGGLWTYKIIKDDTADVAVTLTDDDVVDGEVEWVPIAPMSDQFNEVAGSFIDPSATSLYQPKAYPTVTEASYVAADGFTKRASHNFQSVQDVGLAQKLARVKLNRGRFTGTFRATFNYRALKAQVWSIVRLSIDQYGFSNSIFRVLSQSVTENGIEMLLREDHPSIYAGGTVTFPPAPSQMPKYNVFQQIALTGVTLKQAFESTTANGDILVGIALSWSLAPANVAAIQAQYRPTGTGSRRGTYEWKPFGTIARDDTSVAVHGLLGGATYEARIRTQSTNGVWGAWQTPAPVNTLASTLSAIVDDDVISVAEKLGPLSRLHADLEARENEVKTRATAVGASTTALNAAKTDWKTLLGSYSPRWDDPTADTVIYAPYFEDSLLPGDPQNSLPAGTSVIANADISTWAETGTCPVTADSAPGFYKVEDADASATSSRVINASGLTSGLAYTHVFKVKKSAKTRFEQIVTLHASDFITSGQLMLDMSSGKYDLVGGVTDAAVFDDGDCWVAMFTYVLGNTVMELRVLPAHGAVGVAADAPTDLMPTWAGATGALGSVTLQFVGSFQGGVGAGNPNGGVRWQTPTPLVSSGTIEKVGRYYTLKDTTTGSWHAFLRSKSQPAAATQYSWGIEVKKDATGKATRFPICRLATTGGATPKSYDLAFDTSTGEVACLQNAATSFGKLDLGDAWFFWGTITTPADCTGLDVAVYPAAGNGSTLVTGNYSPTTTGLIYAGVPRLARGDWTKLGRPMLTGKLNDYSGKITSTHKAISEVDGFTSIILGGPTTLSLRANSSGVVYASELPKQAQYSATAGIAAYTTLGTWSRSATSGITCTVGASTGLLEITAMTVASGTISLTFTYAGITRTYNVQVTRIDDPVTSGGGGGGGGGGTSASTTTLGNATSTAYGTGESAVLTVQAGPSGQVALNAPISFMRTSNTNAGTTGAFGKWQWRTAGAGSYADVAAEVADAEPSVGQMMEGVVEKNPGGLTVAPTKTGLTNGASYDFKFLWRKNDEGGTATSIYRLQGTLTATGS